MSETIAVAGVPEVAVGQTQPATQGVPPTFSGKWEDFGRDMAAIESEMGTQTQVQPEQPGPLSQPAQAPVTEQAAPTQTQEPTQPTQQTQTAVPDKFRNPDGSVDQEKMVKSYLEAEKTLKRLQNQVSQPAIQAQAPLTQPMVQPQAPQAQQAPVPQPTQFELQVAQDLINTAAAFGQQISPGQAIAQARVQIGLMEAKHRADVAATFAEVEGFRQTLQEQARKAELESLAKNQPWVLTPQGQAELIRVRQENPLINQAAEPWRAAAIYLLGQRALTGSSGQVTPTPMGTQQTVPPMPAVPAPTTQTPVQLNSPAEVAAYVKGLTPEQEAAFWQKNGFKWEPPRKQYIGI